jgi:hypothetical protein
MQIYRRDGLEKKIIGIGSAPWLFRILYEVNSRSAIPGKRNCFRIHCPAVSKVSRKISA